MSRVSAALVAAACVVLAGGGLGITVLLRNHPPAASHHGGAAAASPTPSATTSASPPAAAPAVIVWVTNQAQTDAITVRVGSALGGFRTLTSVTSGKVLGTDGRHLLYVSGDGHLRDVDLQSGTVREDGYLANDLVRGAAFAPDGSRVMYADTSFAGGALSWSLRVLDFSTGRVSEVATFDRDPIDVPSFWTSAGVLATRAHQPGDTLDLGVALLDPATGQRTATTDDYDGNAGFSADGQHVALTDGHPMGDAILPAVGNTLSSAIVGQKPVPLIAAVNHNFGVLALSPDGSAVLVGDAVTSASGTSETGLGLYLVRSSTETLVSAGSYTGGAFLNPSDFVAMRCDFNAAACGLFEASAGGALHQLDTASGNGGYVFVAGQPTPDL